MSADPNATMPLYLTKVYHVHPSILTEVEPRMGPVSNAPATDATATTWCAVNVNVTPVPCMQPHHYLEEVAPIVFHNDWYPLYWSRMGFSTGSYRGFAVQVEDGHERLMGSHPGRYCLPPQATSLLVETACRATDQPYHWKMVFDVLCDLDEDVLTRYGTDDAVTLVWGRLETNEEGHATFTRDSVSLSLGSLKRACTELAFHYDAGHVKVVCLATHTTVAQVEVDPSHQFFFTMRPCYYSGHTTTAMEARLIPLTEA